MMTNETLFFSGMSTSTLTPSLGGLLTPGAPATTAASSIQEAASMFVPLEEVELLSKMASNGLQVLYRYTRKPHLYSASMTSIQLTLKNQGQDELTEVKIGAKTLAPGMTMHDFPSLASLPSGSSQTVTIGINFNDSTQSAKFDIVASGRVFTVQIQPVIGELVRAVSMPESVFDQEKNKLKGMNEVDANFKLPSAFSDDAGIRKKIYEIANLIQVPTLESGLMKFSGQTTGNKYLVLVSLKLNDGQAVLNVNCEKIVIGNMLVKEIKSAFE